MNMNRPININTFVSGLGALGICLIGYFGRVEFERVSRNQETAAAKLETVSVSMAELKLNGNNLSKDMDGLKLQVQQFITRGEMRAEFTSRDQAILELKKRMESLERRPSTTPSTSPPVTTRRNNN